MKPTRRMSPWSYRVMPARNGTSQSTKARTARSSVAKNVPEATSPVASGTRRGSDRREDQRNSANEQPMTTGKPSESANALQAMRVASRTPMYSLASCNAPIPAISRIPVARRPRAWTVCSASSTNSIPLRCGRTLDDSPDEQRGYGVRRHETASSGIPSAQRASLAPSAYALSEGNGRSRPVSRVLSPRTVASAREADIPLGPALPRASSEPTRELGGPPMPPEGGAPLFALAPGGACRAAAVTGSAVRSYRTVSPLPAFRQAVCFLWRSPASRLGWPLASTLALWSPDFPPARDCAGVRPGSSDRAECNTARRPRKAARNDGLTDNRGGAVPQAAGGGPHSCRASAKQPATYPSLPDLAGTYAHPAVVNTFASVISGSVGRGSPLDSHAGSTLAADVIVANAPDPVFVCDLGGKILEANAAVSQLLGLRRDEVLEQSVSRFLTVPETREFVAALHEVVDRGVTRNLRLNPGTASGEVIATTLNASALRDGAGRTIGVIGILRDMRELDKARAYAESLIKNAPDPVFVSDLRGKILQANDAVYALLGFRPDEVIEQSLSRIISTQETREFIAALREVVEFGVTRNVRLNPRSASGEVIPTTLNASALRDPDGSVIGAIGILRDMRAYEMVLRDLQESKAELQDKIQDLEKFEEVVVGRELKMIALEKELEHLQRELEKLKSERARG